MKLLLDTHTFLWFINDDARLSASAMTLLESANDICLSLVSLWELAIKHSLGKLDLPTTYDQFITQQVLLNDVDLLPIQISHLAVVAQLQFHHCDPFDRLLIAQAIVEDLPLLSADPLFDHYPIKRLW